MSDVDVANHCKLFWVMSINLFSTGTENFYNGRITFDDLNKKKEKESREHETLNVWKN